jgi:hypothetical protein
MNPQNFEGLDTFHAKSQRKQWQTPKILDLHTALSDTEGTTHLGCALTATPIRCHIAYHFS